ncbi:MAG TPA: helix-turn-helix domain-containing protein [Azospira sp.]|nr:helix-turn-helix domain-containing protein [Azospira sp.]
MKVVALLVQPSGMEFDMAEMAARFPGLIPLDAAVLAEAGGLARSGGLATLLADWRFPAAAVPVAPAMREAARPSAAPSASGKSLKELEREFLQRVLAENNGNKTAAAKSLQMHRRTLQRKLSRGS